MDSGGYIRLMQAGFRLFGSVNASWIQTVLLWQCKVDSEGLVPLMQAEFRRFCCGNARWILTVSFR